MFNIIAALHQQVQRNFPKSNFKFTLLSKTTPPLCTRREIRRKDLFLKELNSTVTHLCFPAFLTFQCTLGMTRRAVNNPS